MSTQNEQNPETQEAHCGSASNSTQLLDDNCSGITRVDGELKCKHGFPLFPQCRNEPMKERFYGGKAPCMNEMWTKRLFSESGKPKQLVI